MQKNIDITQENHNKKAGNRPNYTGNGVAVWVNINQETNKPYLAINIVGHKTIYAYENNLEDNQEYTNMPPPYNTSNPNIRK